MRLSHFSPNDKPKFGTYTRDSWSGLDYAMNRYYYSSWGRFTSPDPYQSSGGVTDPGSWNRYAYVGGDPVNRTDKSGLNYDICADMFEMAHVPYCVQRKNGGWFITDSFGPERWVTSFTPNWDYDPTLVGGYDEGGGGRSNTKSDQRTGFLCDPKVIQAMTAAWMKAGNGARPVEAGFRLDGPLDDFKIEVAAYTNEQGSLSMDIVKGTTFAILHTHPTASGGKPSTPETSKNGRGDTWVADTYHVDMYVMHHTGLYVYEWKSKQTHKLADGRDWQKPCIN